VSAVQRGMEEAAGCVRSLEAGLAVALQKDEAAARALKDAEFEAAITAEEAALAHLRTIGLKFDTILTELEQFLDGELVPAIDRARTVSGPGSESAFLVDTSLAVELYVSRACRSFIVKGRAYGPLTASRKFSDRLPDATYARERRGR
jgi:hypothetical protein